MCKMKSMILTQDKVFCPDYDSHSDMLIELGIKDNKRVPDFVKIEITPPDGDMRRPPEEWRYSVDQDELPPWYVQEIDEPRCRKSLVDWYAAHVFTEGHHEVHSGKVWLFVNSIAVLRDNSSAVLYDNSIAVLRGNSSAELYDNSSAELYDNSSAVLRDNSSAVLYHNASAELRDNSSAVLRGNSSAELRGNSSAVLYENSTAKLYDNSVSIYRADYWARPVVRIAGEVND